MLFDEHFRLRFKQGNVEWQIVYLARKLVSQHVHKTDHGITEHDGRFILFKCVDSLVAICISTSSRDYIVMYKWITNLPLALNIKKINSFDLIRENAKIHVYTANFGNSI